MDRDAVISYIGPVAAERGCFLVEVKISADNEIVITLEKERGSVEMEDCAAVDRAMHERFSQDEEDYALTVTSAGLDQPFKVLRQYEKAIGSLVTVQLKGGRRLTGELTGADEESISLRYTVLEKKEGKKRKEPAERHETFQRAGVNTVTPYIDFNKNLR